MSPTTLSKWDNRWLNLAKFISSFSKDPSTKVGAVIARGKEHLSFGYNGFPPQIEDRPEWYEDRETKYKLVTHAEINAILNAREKVNGWSLYLYPLPPCDKCAQYIVASGISRVVTLFAPDYTNTARYLDFSTTEFVFDKGGVQFELYRFSE